MRAKGGSRALAVMLLVSSSAPACFFDYRFEPDGPGADTAGNSTSDGSADGGPDGSSSNGSSGSSGTETESGDVESTGDGDGDTTAGTTGTGFPNSTCSDYCAVVFVCDPDGNFESHGDCVQACHDGLGKLTAECAGATGLLNLCVADLDCAGYTDLLEDMLPPAHPCASEVNVVETTCDG